MHTPGPWMVDQEFSDSPWVLDSDGFPVADAQDIAILPNWSEKVEGIDHWSHARGIAFIERSTEEVVANARLIAAAPELLDASRDALHQMASPGKFDIDAWGAAVTKVAAAIAKAEGRA
jgi:hypothetical protein